MPELCGQLARKVDQRRPEPVKALQHHRMAVGEELQHPVVDDLIGNSRAYPTGPCVPGRIDDGSLLDQADERRAQPTPGEQLVDRIE